MASSAVAPFPGCRVGPSPVPDVLFREVPKQMEIEDIKEVVQYFCKSAIHARGGRV